MDLLLEVMIEWWYIDRNIKIYGDTDEKSLFKTQVKEKE